MTIAAAAEPVKVFLRYCGLDAAVIERLAGTARTSGSTIDVVAVSEGLLTHDTLMAGLAEVLGCAYLDDLTDIAIAADLTAFQAEAVRITDPRGATVLACPSGDALSYLLGTAQRPRPWLALTGRTRFRERLRAELGASLAEAAARRPATSSEKRAGFGQSSQASWVGPAVLLMLGLVLLPLAWLGAGWVAIVAAGLAPLFLLVVVLRLAATSARVAYDPPRRLLDDARLPSYAAIVPLYREAAVIPQLVRSLESIDYPRSKFSVLLALEQEDQETRLALEEMVLPAWIEVIVAPEGQPRTKPRALNIALAQTSAQLVTIFDAEDVPDADQLRIAATCLMHGPADVGAYQAALDIDNGEDSMIAGLFALEYAVLFRLINPYLHSVALPFLLGGTSNHFRRADLEAIGGWDAANLTEDAEIGIRLLQHGLSIRTLPSRTQEEAPIAWRNWLRQRIRWMKGFMQTLACVMTKPKSLLNDDGPGALLTVVVLLAGTVLSALCLPFAWAGLVIVLIHEPWPVGNQLGQAALYSVGLVLFLSGLMAMILPALAIGRQTTARWHRLLAFLTPLYALAVSAAAWIAIVELVRRPLYWNKTEHGVSPSRRMRAQLGADGGGGSVDVQ